MSPEGLRGAAIITSMYLDDGEPFPGTYEPVPNLVRAVAVGWLDRSHGYNLGSVEEGFVSRLFDACRVNATARTRGWHRCSFCSGDGEPEVAPTTVIRDGESLAVGDAEIRVVAKDGTWLIAPTLVLHYVTEHAYRPPLEFIEAVASGRFVGT
jgi:hypothetical protein